jgi:2-hydroxychromene-2-carboxylate isomerase
MIFVLKGYDFARTLILASAMNTFHWYFDFISPYAWLQSTQLEALRARAEVRCIPILFAGLLKHWGQKGPAEMATKRIYTYRQIAWYAQQQGLKLTWPARHPFNPLPLLRLCAFLGSTPKVVDRLFAYVWRDGHLPDEPEAWKALLDELRVKPADLDSIAVKDSIRLNTEDAIAAGVFGVPSAIVQGREEMNPAASASRLGESTSGSSTSSGRPSQTSPIFWGFDATPMLHAWLDGDSFFDSSAYLGASQVGDGVVRKS